MAEKCTKTSAPPPSCSMKPKPFSLLNHFTVPVATGRAFSVSEAPRVETSDCRWFATSRTHETSRAGLPRPALTTRTGTAPGHDASSRRSSCAVYRSGLGPQDLLHRPALGQLVDELVEVADL